MDAALSLVILLLVALPVGYWLALALAATRAPARPNPAARLPSTRFAVVIAAHNEEAVITATVAGLRCLDYPPELVDIHIVADHCSDRTAALARQAGATVHERNAGPRLGKGAALDWLFKRILDAPCDAVVVFDADTQVAVDFLRLMDLRLAEGAQAIQGQHIIRNPEDGWFPALTYAMFLVDNRFQNLGRSNLGWSAKNMGDAICLRADILRRLGWGAGLTEDYHLRQRLLLEGIAIRYEPFAQAYGEAPRTWHQARAQRARWLRGTHTASRQMARPLLAAALGRRSLAVLDGALQARLPSYSTLAVICVAVVVLHWLGMRFGGRVFPAPLLYAWLSLCAVLFAYPLFGLALERAPAKAYAAILSGPVFIVWRTILAVIARRSRQPEVWVRTAHGETE